jgi:transcription-repair coupling factor (superfamily II helicase)
VFHHDLCENGAFILKIYLDNMASSKSSNLLAPKLPSHSTDLFQAGQLYGSSQGLLLAKAAQQHTGPILVITDDTAAAHRLELEAKFYLGDDPLPIMHFPDWETLPYDTFSLNA